MSVADSMRTCGKTKMCVHFTAYLLESSLDAGICKTLCQQNAADADLAKGLLPGRCAAPLWLVLSTDAVLLLLPLLVRTCPAGAVSRNAAGRYRGRLSLTMRGLHCISLLCLNLHTYTSQVKRVHELANSPTGGQQRHLPD